jgi:hypothetical protein
MKPTFIFSALMLCFISSFSQVKIIDLPDYNNPASPAYLPVTSAGVTYKLNTVNIGVNDVYVRNDSIFKKRYGNDTMLYEKGTTDKRSMSAYGIASVDPTLGQTKGFSSFKKSVFFAKNDSTYLFYTHLGREYWCEYQLATKSGSTLPYSFNQTRIQPYYSYILATDTLTDVTYVSHWIKTSLVSQDPAVYVGGRAAYSLTVGDSIIVNITGGNIYLVYSKDPRANYIGLRIDGDTALVNKITSVDGSGNKYIDPYASVTTHKQVVQIAQGLPTGNHVLSIKMLSGKNALGDGANNRLFFNAVAIVSDTKGSPDDVKTDAPLWKASTVYADYAQVKYNGNYYSATTGGTTSTTPPTHLTGSATDGTVTWLYMSSSSFATVDQYLQRPGSQAEYAVQIKPNGTTSLEYFGGLVHGNEILLSKSLYIDGVKKGIVNGSYYTGDEIIFKQQTKVTHSQTGTAQIAHVDLSHQFNSTGLNITHKESFDTTGVFGQYYIGMWPLIHYFGAQGKYGVLDLYSPQAGNDSIKNFYNQNNPIIGRTRDFVMVGTGNALQPDGSGGLPSPGKPLLKFNAVMSIDPQSVDYYNNGNSVFAGKAMNITSNASETYSSVVSKMYFEKYSATNPKSFYKGMVVTGNNHYRINLYDSIEVKLHQPSVYAQNNIIDNGLDAVLNNGATTSKSAVFGTLQVTNTIPSGDSSNKTASTAWIKQNISAGNGSNAVTYSLELTPGSLATPASATTYIGGPYNLTGWSTTAGLNKLYIPKGGTIKKASVFIYVNGTLASAGNASFYIRKNNTTDYLISSAATMTATTQQFSNASMSVPVADDFADYVELKMVTPTWTTAPTNLRITAVLWIE